MKHASFLAVSLVVFAALQTPAMAFAVDIPVHDGLNFFYDLLVNVGIPAAATLLIFAARSLPYSLGSLLKRQQVEQALKWAVEFGLAEGLKTAPTKITLDVRNVFAATAFNYVIKHAPDYLQKWMGGPDMIREKIDARINEALTKHGLPVVPE